MCLAQHGELCWHPCPDRLVIVDRPGGTHRNNHVKIRRIGKLDLDVGGEKTIFPDHLVEDEIEAAVYQPLPYEAGSTDVIMLDEQGAHLAQSSLGPNDLAFEDLLEHTEIGGY